MPRPQARGDGALRDETQLRGGHSGDDGRPGADHELATNLREVFTITEKAPTSTFSLLKTPTCAFTFKTCLLVYEFIKTLCCTGPSQHHPRDPAQPPAAGDPGAAGGRGQARPGGGAQLCLEGEDRIW